MKVPTLRQRASGLLLHPTSLPGAHGSGDLGHQARGFVDFLASAGQRWWQMLPIGPPGYGESPYSAESAFAGSPLLVSLDALADDGWLDQPELLATEPLRADAVDFPPTERHRLRCLQAAFRTFDEGRGRPDARLSASQFDGFCRANAHWLDDYALFRALKHAHGGAPWTLWDAGVRARDPKTLETARGDLAASIRFEKFAQYAFETQWLSLRAYAAERGVGLIGDLPIFIAHDSADVWQSPDAFFLDRDGHPTFVAGVPPDYFSVTGQRWGNPLYRWQRMRRRGYSWWIERLRIGLRRFDVLRLDHFIGFQRYWRIPANEPTATRGQWMKGPGADFFDTVNRALGALPLIAEDLGEVTPRVYALRDRYHLPGIKILQFAFGKDPAAPSFLPHNHRRRAVVYTGTHDNDTTVGWFRDAGGGGTPRTAAEASQERAAALRYLGTDGEEIHWDMIRTALASVARLTLFPLQDALGLGSEARMNRPGEATGNWTWRFGAHALAAPLSTRLRGLTETYGRAPPTGSAHGKAAR